MAFRSNCSRILEIPIAEESHGSAGIGSILAQACFGFGLIVCAVVRVNSLSRTQYCTPIDRWPLPCRGHLARRSVHPGALARRSAVRQDVPLPESVSVRRGRSLAWPLSRTCNQCLRRSPGSNSFVLHAYSLLPATRSLSFHNRDMPAGGLRFSNYPFVLFRFP